VQSRIDATQHASLMFFHVGLFNAPLYFHQGAV